MIRHDYSFQPKSERDRERVGEKQSVRERWSNRKRVTDGRDRDRERKKGMKEKEYSRVLPHFSYSQ